MRDERHEPRLGSREFVALAAFMMSVFAFSLDSMLPALSEIGRDLGVGKTGARPTNDDQLVVSALILGMAIGQLVYGPLSDSVGRKLSIYAGLALFSVGCIVSIAANDFPVMLAGRFLQGLGAAGPRIVTVALIRDQYDGPAMARIMSFVVAVFMVVPVLAPLLGQGILLVAHWRVIFLIMLALGLGVLGWFAIRQPETLPKVRRIPFSLRPIALAVREICASRVALGHTIAAGLALGGLFGYITSARQIFQDQYGVGALFPIYFSVLAPAIGGAAILNARLVMRFGMRILCYRAIVAKAVLSILFFVVAHASAGSPPLWTMMIYLAAVFFCLGILFGNLNAMAMEPLGHIAGIAAGFVGSLTWFIAMILGTLIGQSFDGTILPLVAGFSILGLASICVMHWVR